MSGNKYHRAPLALAISSSLAISATQAATITVDTLADPGAAGECSLRSAVESVNTQTAVNACSAGDGVDDVIVFDSSLSGSILLTDGRLELSADVIISGPDAATLAIDAQGSSGVFYLDSVAAEISGLTLTGGNEDFGGALYLSGTELSLSDCVISGNEAVDNGGGIEVFGDSRLLVDNCEFSDNTAGLNGGGVAVTQGYASITNSAFLNNSAGLGGGAQVNNYILSPGATPTGPSPDELSAQLIIDNGVFWSNSAAYGGGVGAGYASAGGIILSLRNSVVTSASRGAPAQENLTVSNTAIYGNSAYFGGGVATVPPIELPGLTRGGPTPGPGLQNISVFYNTDIYDNTAEFGGGIASVASGLGFIDSSLSDNTAYYSGGGALSLESFDGAVVTGASDEAPYLIIESSDVSRNSVLYPGTPLRGGPLYPARGSGGGLTTVGGTSYVLNSLMEDNYATRAGGGAFAKDGSLLVFGSEVNQNVGGGLYTFTSQLDIGNSQLSRNSVDGDFAAGLQCEFESICSAKYSEVVANEEALVGGIGTDLRGGLAPSTLSLSNVTVSGNAGSLVGGVRAPSLSMSFSTVAFNSSLALPRGGLTLSPAGGVSTTGEATVANSIVSSNTDSLGASDIRLDVGTLGMDFSLVGDAAGLSYSGLGNLVDVDPLLAPLDFNGGPFVNGRTHALAESSPAIDAGSSASPPDFDQRGTGFDRVSGPSPDMGAFEFQAPPPPDPIFSDRFQLK